MTCDQGAVAVTKRTQDASLKRRRLRNEPKGGPRGLEIARNEPTQTRGATSVRRERTSQTAKWKGRHRSEESILCPLANRRPESTKLSHNSRVTRDRMDWRMLPASDRNVRDARTGEFCVHWVGGIGALLFIELGTPDGQTWGASRGTGARKAGRVVTTRDDGPKREASQRPAAAPLRMRRHPRPLAMFTPRGNNTMLRIPNIR
jgi:hypothetical protein